MSCAAALIARIKKSETTILPSREGEAGNALHRRKQGCEVITLYSPTREVVARGGGAALPYLMRGRPARSVICDIGRPRWDEALERTQPRSLRKDWKGRRSCPTMHNRTQAKRSLRTDTPPPSNAASEMPNPRPHRQPTCCPFENLPTTCYDFRYDFRQKNVHFFCEYLKGLNYLCIK